MYSYVLIGYIIIMCKYLDNYPGVDKCTVRSFKRGGRGGGQKVAVYCTLEGMKVLML